MFRLGANLFQFILVSSCKRNTHTRPYFSVSHVLTHLILLTTPKGRYHYCVHFIERETKEQRSSVTCPKHRADKVRLRLVPRVVLIMMYREKGDLSQVLDLHLNLYGYNEYFNN